MSLKLSETAVPAELKKQKMGHNVEFFHIYTDEVIGNRHDSSIEYLSSASQAWDFEFSTIILIDNYNPEASTLSSEDVLDYLDKKGALPRFWAFEADMVSNAQVLVDSLHENKLKRKYLKYISDHNKYPCSLLTATWYLTRLGYLDYQKIQPVLTSDDYVPAERLINILPAGYKDVEMRARKIIKNSPFIESLDGIQDLFIPVETRKIKDIF